LNDRIDALERLHRLHAQGVLSDEEYAREKAAIIGEDQSQSPSPQQQQVQRARLERQELVWNFSLKRALIWALAAMLVCLAIGGYFFVKAHNLAKERGELSEGTNAVSPEDASPTVVQSEAPPAGPVLSASVALPDPLSIPIIAQYEQLNETCRGGSGDEPATMKACDDREALYPKVSAQGYCYGTLDDPDEASKNWHRCGPRSLR
jgi:hypothetical protein